MEVTLSGKVLRSVMSVKVTVRYLFRKMKLKTLLVVKCKSKKAMTIYTNHLHDFMVHLVQNLHSTQYQNYLLLIFVFYYATVESYFQRNRYVTWFITEKQQWPMTITEIKVFVAVLLKIT